MDDLQSVIQDRGEWCSRELEDSLLRGKSEREVGGTWGRPVVILVSILLWTTPPNAGCGLGFAVGLL